MQLDFTKKPEQSNSDAGIEYTHKIINVLKNKVKEINATNEKKITLLQLKSVFIEGAKTDKENFVLSGFARVNMFIRLYCSSSFAHEFRSKSQIKVNKSSILDFSSYISPSIEDVQNGLDDAKIFTDATLTIDDLYLEKPVGIAHYNEYL